MLMLNPNQEKREAIALEVLKAIIQQKLIQPST